MELTIAERVHLYDMLPDEGNVTTIRAISEAQSTIGLSPEELEQWSVTNENGKVRWDSGCDTNTEIEVSSVITDIAIEELNRLNDEDKLTVGQLSLWDKFVSPNGQTQ